MNGMKLGDMEQRFAEMIWEHAPIESGELVRMCAQAFDWKKSTTYTMLRRLCDRGLFRNRDGIVEILLTREQFLSRQSKNFVKETFSGSLPRFLAAFAAEDKLSEDEITALEQLIASYRKGDEQS